MPRWSHRINIRQHLTEDESKEAQIAAADGIAKEIKLLPDALWQRGGKHVCAELRKAAETGNIGWFNASLSRVWDWFDEERIWVEF